MIDNLVGLYRVSGAEIQVYMHADLISMFVTWLNENNPETVGDSNSLSWKAASLDAAALLNVRESDNLYPLLVDRIKIGYARSLEQQTLFQDLLNLVFPANSLREWHI